MLLNYEHSQSQAIQILQNSLRANRISHAYLFETNGFNESNILIKEFVKSIFCKEKKDNCDCDSCKAIENEAYSDVKFIDTDSTWIRKEQIEELQTEFIGKSMNNKQRVYVIWDASKLNTVTANSILKFLEEPADGIIAILAVENRYQVLNTILSRCQLIQLRNSQKSKNKKENLASVLFKNTHESNLFISDEKYNKLYNNALSFIAKLEIEKADTLIYTNKIIDKDFMTKESTELIIQILIYFYFDVLNYTSTGNTDYFEIEEIKNIMKETDSKRISEKIEIATQIREGLKFNANISLTFDRLAIKLGGI